MAPRALIIDCDPGIDDAIALLLAFACPEALDVRAVTTVAGNVTVDRATRNALHVRDVARRPDAPIYSGASCPLACPLQTAEHIHGAGGLGGLRLPDPSGTAAPGHAVDALAALLADSAEPVTLALLAPQTNIALLFEQAPWCRDAIAEIVFMGGSAVRGNVTPYAEFNMHIDPHAAAAVLASGVPCTMVGLDVTRQVRVTAERQAQLAALETPSARLAASLLATYGIEQPDGEPLHDPCVIAYLLEPGLFGGDFARTSVECHDPDRLGQTVVEPTDTGSPGAVRVLDRIDVDGFFDLLAGQLGRGSAHPPAAVAAGRPGCQAGRDAI
jgi:purine nucleosidase